MTSADCAPERDTINISNELHVVADQALQVLADTNEPPTLFSLGGRPARLREDDLGPRLELLTPPALRDVLSRRARWVRTRDGNEVPVRPPGEVVSNLVHRASYPFPSVDGVVSAPVLGQEGELLTEPGYHAASRTYYQPTSDMARFVFEDPNSYLDVVAARHHLVGELLADFPFATKADLANAVALMICPFVRPMIEGSTPIHLIDGSSPGAGKSLLTQAALTPAMGPVPTASAPQSDEEWRKRLTATLSAGSAVVAIDNIAGRFDSPSLASALTSGIWEDRILGSTEMVRFPVRPIWVATLNNASLTTELTRRSVRIRLRPDEERPWERPSTAFRHPDLLVWARRHRRALVDSTLTLCRWWVLSGAPDGQERLGSFERWSAVLGGILGTAEIEGFLTNREELYEDSDSISGEMNEMLEAWFEVFGTVPVRSRDVALAMLDPASPLYDARPSELATYRGDALSARLGYLLREHRETVYDGKRVIVDREDRRHANLWRVERVDGR